MMLSCEVRADNDVPFQFQDAFWLDCPPLLIQTSRLGVNVAQKWRLSALSEAPKLSPKIFFTNTDWLCQTIPIEGRPELAKSRGFPSAHIANFAIVPVLTRNWVSRAYISLRRYIAISFCERLRLGWHSLRRYKLLCAGRKKELG
jgi:hypothetical protein